MEVKDGEEGGARGKDKRQLSVKNRGNIEAGGIMHPNEVYVFTGYTRHLEIGQAGCLWYPYRVPMEDKRLYTIGPHPA
jgi:hypothetical protein